MAIHRTTSGDCLSSIASANRFRDWRTVYDAPENEALRRARPNPNTLLVGDSVTVPNWLDHQEACNSTQRHTFVARQLTTRVRLKLRAAEQVWVELRVGAAEPLRRAIDGEAELALDIAADARGGVLYVWLGRDATSVEERPPDAVFDLVLGALPPATTTEGASARLVNLGHASEADATNHVAEASILAYQRQAGLKQTGAADALTCSSLEKDHDR